MTDWKASAESAEKQRDEAEARATKRWDEIERIYKERLDEAVAARDEALARLETCITEKQRQHQAACDNRLRATQAEAAKSVTPRRREQEGEGWTDEDRRLLLDCIDCMADRKTVHEKYLNRLRALLAESVPDSIQPKRCPTCGMRREEMNPSMPGISEPCTDTFHSQSLQPGGTD